MKGRLELPQAMKLEQILKTQKSLLLKNSTKSARRELRGCPRNLKVDRKFVTEIGICIWIAYCSITVISFVAYHVFKVPLIPAFFASPENALFLSAGTALIPTPGDAQRRPVWLVALYLIMGICTLGGGFLVLSRGYTIPAFLILATSTLLILLKVRELYSKCRVRQK